MQLDNEALPAFQALLKHNSINCQLFPPGMHRHNAAERSISTFKDHFIARIHVRDPDFPMHNWDRLLYQAEITINLLCPSRLNPRLLADAQLNGKLDFNRIPISPAGKITLVRDKPHNRCTWAPHGHKV